MFWEHLHRFKAMGIACFASLALRVYLTWLNRWKDVRLVDSEEKNVYAKDEEFGSDRSRADSFLVFGVRFKFPLHRT